MDRFFIELLDQTHVKIILKNHFTKRNSMKRLLSAFMILVTLHGTFSCMKKNITDTRFCCPYCFEKFILKQLFQDHLLAHPEVTVLGPIPGHTPYLGIYSTPEDIEKKLRALQKAFQAVEMPE